MSEEEGKKGIVQRIPVFFRDRLHAIIRRVLKHAKRN